jgi:hypothetical protein
MLARVLYTQHRDALLQPGSNTRAASESLLRTLDVTIDFGLIASNELLSQVSLTSTILANAEINAVSVGVQTLEQLLLELFDKTPNRFGAFVPSAAVPDLLHTLQFCVVSLTQLRHDERLSHASAESQSAQRTVSTLASSPCSLRGIRTALTQLVADTHRLSQISPTLGEVIAEARGSATASAVTLPSRRKHPCVSNISSPVSLAAIEWVLQSGIQLPAALLWETISREALVESNLSVSAESLVQHIHRTYGGAPFSDSCLSRLSHALCGTTPGPDGNQNTEPFQFDTLSVITRDSYERAMSNTEATSAIASLSRLVDNQCAVFGMGNVWAEQPASASVANNSKLKVAVSLNPRRHLLLICKSHLGCSESV